jgi:hypothetical protein
VQEIKNNKKTTLKFARNSNNGARPSKLRVGCAPAVVQSHTLDSGRKVKCVNLASRM